jgi:hypothetical protein
VSNLAAADALRIGLATVSKVYLGAKQVWPKATVPVTIHGTPTTGTAGNGTTATITLPSYVAGDYVVLAVSRNQVDASAWTGDASAAVTEIATASRRLSLLSVQPTGTPGSFVLHASTTGVWSWCCLNLGQVTPSVQTAVRAIGNSTTAAVEFDPIAAAATTDGNQLVLAIAGTNATASWTAPSGTVARATLAAAPGLLAASYAPTAGLTTISVPNASRGSEGINRFENSMAILLRA